MQSVSPTIAWIQDVGGNALITFRTLLEGARSLILAADCGIQKSLGARVSYRKFHRKGNDADRYSDRDFVTFSPTRHFYGGICRCGRVRRFCPRAFPALACCLGERAAWH